MQTMKKFEFGELVAFLSAEFEADLRWVAVYNAETYDYNFRFIRDDLKTELTGNQLDYLIHRSLAVYNKRHAEEVYFHLGEADSLVVDYDRGRAIHVFLDDVRGVTIMVEPDRSIRLPEFSEACRDRIHRA